MSNTMDSAVRIDFDSAEFADFTRTMEFFLHPVPWNLSHINMIKVYHKQSLIHRGIMHVQSTSKLCKGAKGIVACLSPTKCEEAFGLHTRKALENKSKK